MNRTQIYFTKCRKVILPNCGEGPKAPFAEVMTAAKNIQALGYGLTHKLLHQLQLLTSKQLAKWYEKTYPALQEAVGAHREFNPMYPNFPKQVMEASDAELYFNAMTHYFGFVLSDMLNDPNLVILPNYEKEARPILEEFHSLRWLDAGTPEDFNTIFTRLAGSNGSLSEQDREILAWFVQNRDIAPLLPEAIPQKETLAHLVALVDDPHLFVPLIKSATDVLRVAVAMSDGDISLAEPTRFRNFRKSERRFLLQCLENTNSRTEDMLRWRERWVRLGEKLHPGDFKKRFPQSLTSFSVLRNKERYSTFNSEVEAMLAKQDTIGAAATLINRPGEFARRLDHVLRLSPLPEQILNSFLSVADKVSTPVLLQAWAHFNHRPTIQSRAFFPKGNASKVQFKEGKLPSLPEGIAYTAARKIRQVLVDRFSSLPTLGKVYVDDSLKNHLVPFSQRSASRALRTVSRGSSFDLPEGNTVRFFVWWKNISADDFTGRVDLDLSASLFGSDWENNGAVAYYNLRQGKCYHSGDITSAPKGACEFIDIDLPHVLESGSRYVVMSVLSFTGQQFLSLPECFAGWMMRQEPKSGEIFEPKTVQDKVDITAATRSCVPLVIDAQERKIYWTDLGLKSFAQLNNAARNSSTFSQIGRAITTLKKPTFYDLFRMHVEARGTAAPTPEEAEVVYGVHDGDVTAFDGDVVLSEYMK